MNVSQIKTLIVIVQLVLLALQIVFAVKWMCIPILLLTMVTLALTD